MLNIILQLLPHAPKGESIYIDRAKGKYQLPENFKQLKSFLKWQSQK